MPGLVQIESEERETIRVFPERNQWTPTDSLVFTGPPPLPQFRPTDKNTPVFVSVTFTWHRAYAEQLAQMWRAHYGNVRIGGPAYDDPGGEFTPGRFLKIGCTITSRGCPKKCGWCKVPFSEGNLRELRAIQPGWIVQDNNLLACSRPHLERVFSMLRQQGKRIFFNGGLDKHFLQSWHRELFDSISIGELWFACDIGGTDLGHLERAAKILDGIPKSKWRCYTMVGYDGETIEQAEARIRSVYQLGFLPFSQLYQPPTADRPTKLYPLEWKHMNRKWSRPAIYKSTEVRA